MKSSVGAAFLALAISLSSATPLENVACHKFRNADGVVAERCVPTCGEAHPMAGPCVAMNGATSLNTELEKRGSVMPCVTVEGKDRVKRCVPACGDKREVNTPCMYLDETPALETRDGATMPCRDMIKDGMVVRRCVPMCGDKKRDSNIACMDVEERNEAKFPCRDVLEDGVMVRRCVPMCGDKKRDVNTPCLEMA